MLYPVEARSFIDKRKDGTGNLMYYAFENCIIPVYKENAYPDMPDKILDVLNDMIHSQDFSDVYVGIDVIFTLINGNYINKLNIDIDKLSKMLLYIKQYIKENEATLKEKINYMGNISFYEEFYRKNESLGEKNFYEL